VPQEIRSFCTLCRSQCGTVNIVENGRLIAVRPDPTHPTGQAACLKGKAGPEIVAAGNRILYPMRRTAPKTAVDPGWERISWDEALATCAERIAAIKEESGAEAVSFAVTTKSGTGIADSVEWVDRFVRVFGSPNVAGAVDICNWHKDVAHKFTFGVGTGVADYANADLILLWGHNPTNTWLAQADAIARGRAAGAALIVVDPRLTPLAQEADVWLRVRPGTDAALAMGLSNLLITEGGTDWPFVSAWTNAPILVREDDGRFLRARDLEPDGGDALLAWDTRADAPATYDTKRPADERQCVAFALVGRFEASGVDGRPIACRPAFDLFAASCAAWTPVRVEAATGVPEEKLRAAAALLGARQRIAYHAWNGVGQSTNATQTERAIATLYALRGCFDTVGSNRILAKHPANKVDAPSLMAKGQLSKALGAAERPLGPPAEGRVKPVDLYRALAGEGPYPVRALVAFGTNQLMTQGDTEVIRRGLEAAEFHVHCDIVATPTARYADLLLPVSTPWEREALRVGFEISEAAEELIQLRPAAVAPRGEARSDLEIVFGLATHLGLGDRFFGGSVEAGWNHVLEPLGLTADDLRAAGGRISRPLKHAVRKYAVVRPDGTVVGFGTETRRVEFYSELLLRHGQSPLPVQPGGEAEDPAFPLMLTSMKNGYFCHSQHHGIASLRRRFDAPPLYLHPALAVARGIEEGSWVGVRSRHGEARFRAHFDSNLDEGVVAAEFGWWEGCEPLGKPSFASGGPASSNFNALVSADRRDPISGSVAHKAVPCELFSIRIGADRWDGFRAFHVERLDWETPSALSITIAAVDGATLPDFEPGQYLRIRVDHPTEGALTRAYSLTGPARLDGRTTYSLCVGLPTASPESPGVVSSHLHRALRPGQVIEAEAPSGHFTIPLRSSVPIVLVATGIGITPFVSYLESLGDGTDMPELHLLYGNRDGGQHAFAARLRALEAALPRLTVRNFYSRPRPQDVCGQDHHVAARLGAGAVGQDIVDARARFYMCGSDAMIDSVRTGLVARGVARFDIFSEIFASPAKFTGDPDQTFRVSLRRSGVDFVWKASDGTLLDCAEKRGVRAPSGCRVGQCESCAVKVLSGQAIQLSGSAPEEADMVFTCQGVPVSDLVLDL